MVIVITKYDYSLFFFMLPCFLCGLFLYTSLLVGAFGNDMYITLKCVAICRVY